MKKSSHLNILPFLILLIFLVSSPDFVDCAQSFYYVGMDMNNEDMAYY